MKITLFILPIMFVACMIASCSDDNTWEDYEEWRQTNETWLREQQSLLDDEGNLFYQRVIPKWNKSAYILIHYFNDRKLTDGNLSPLFTSTVDVKYIGHLYNGEPFDSSYVNTTHGDSIYRTTLGDVIEGWAIALEDMRVGDSVRIVVPQAQGYGASYQGSIPPYSALEFDIKLVDIPYYEIKPQ